MSPRVASANEVGDHTMESLPKDVSEPRRDRGHNTSPERELAHEERIFVYITRPDTTWMNQREIERSNGQTSFGRPGVLRVRSLFVEAHILNHVTRGND